MTITNSVKIRACALEEHETCLPCASSFGPITPGRSLKKKKMEFLDDPNREHRSGRGTPQRRADPDSSSIPARLGRGCSTHPVGYIEAGMSSQLTRRSASDAGSSSAARIGHALRVARKWLDAEDWNAFSHMAHRALGYAEAIRLVCYSKKLE